MNSRVGNALRAAALAVIGSEPAERFVDDLERANAKAVRRTAAVSTAARLPASRAKSVRRRIAERSRRANRNR